MQASDRLNINSQLEHLQVRYVGTGHADQGRFKLAADIKRDLYASFIGRHYMLAYIGISENESIGRERYNYMQKLTRPSHYYMPDSSNTATSGGDDSDTDTTRIVSDNEPYRDNISDTANTVSNTPPICQSVQSSPCQIVEAVLADPEEFSDPNSVSDTGPYHDNMRDTSYTEVYRTAFEIPVSQSVPSSSCGIAEEVLADPEEFSDPNSVSDTPVSQSVPSSPSGIAEEVLADPEEFSDPNSVSDTPVSQSVPSSPSGIAEEVLADPEEFSDPNSVSDTPVSQSVPSSPSGIVRKVRTLQELYETTQVVADPNSVSETGPYHDNMPDTSYTEVPKTTSDTPVSQSVPSSPCGIENASPLRTSSGER